MPSCIWQVKTTEKKIYLTFDDGPIPEITEWVLDILDLHGIKATFFCVGDNIRKHPHIFKKVLEKGHSAGNHTYNHLKGWHSPDEVYYDNIRLWEEEVGRVGIQLKNKPIFRPPYGQITFRQARHLCQKYDLVMWDIITGDFDPSLNSSHCLTKSIQLTRPGTVIVFHDSLKAFNNLQAILPGYIETMLQKGYLFSTF